MSSAVAEQISSSLDLTPSVLDSGTVCPCSCSNSRVVFLLTGPETTSWHTDCIMVKTISYVFVQSQHFVQQSPVRLLSSEESKYAIVCSFLRIFKYERSKEHRCAKRHCKVHKSTFARSDATCVSLVRQLLAGLRHSAAGAFWKRSEDVNLLAVAAYQSTFFGDGVTTLIGRLH